jgi:cysteine-rich repeat protein
MRHDLSRFSILTAVLTAACGTDLHFDEAPLGLDTTGYDDDSTGGSSSDADPQSETSEGGDMSTTGGSESESTGSSCFTGSLGCPCDRNDTCDEGLRCTAGECIAGSTCGNGIVEEGEECDDGNDIDDDGCTNACTLPTCGDGIVQDGEECDDGNDIDDDECTNACTLPTCGDGIVQDGEECDDGNDIDDDECTNACTLPTCGDGIVQAGEECDDGNDDDNDGCLSTCVVATCGDGFVYTGVEDCDGDLPGGNDCAALGDWTEGEFVCGDDCVADIGSCLAELDNTNSSCTHQIQCLNGGAHAQQECFVNLDLPLPYSLSEIAYNIFDTDDPEDVALEVYSWTGGGPGALLASQPLSTSDVEVGAHTIELSTPLEIQASSFCVGLRANGMFTMSRDPTSSAGHHSFIEVPACGANTFVPISAATATGNYCIRPTLLP